MKQVLILILIVTFVSCGGDSSGRSRTGDRPAPDPFEEVIGSEVSPTQVLISLRAYSGKVKEEDAARRIKNILDFNQDASTISDYINRGQVGADKNFKMYSSLVRKNANLADFTFAYGDKESELPSYDYKSISTLSGFKIALDPKFLGGDLTLDHEKRYVRIEDGAERINFSEAAINYYVADLLKYLLKKKGADVLMTREHSSDHIYHKDFTDYVADEYPRDVDIYVRRNFKTKAERDRQREILLKAITEDVSRVYYDFYSLRLEAARAQMINKFAPHVTLRIGMHLNGSFDDANGGVTINSDKNFCLAIIPGGYKRENLENTISSRIYFARYVMTPFIDYSQSAAEAILDGFQQAESTNIDPADESNFPSTDDFFLTSKRVLKTDPTNPAISAIRPGLLAKIERYFEYMEGPVVEVRAGVQDNLEEAKKLMEGLQEAVANSHDYSQVSKENRLMQIAEGYLKGILVRYTDKTFTR